MGASQIMIGVGISLAFLLLVTPFLAMTIGAVAERTFRFDAPRK
jgi:Na+-transporting methylmalonyl-CoA/oxaloacetate decarboxylase gamma subunit